MPLAPTPKMWCVKVDGLWHISRDYIFNANDAQIDKTLGNRWGDMEWDRDGWHLHTWCPAILHLKGTYPTNKGNEDRVAWRMFDCAVCWQRIRDVLVVQ